MRIFLVASAVFFLGMNTVTAQEVHRDEIENFEGVLAVERSGTKWDDWKLADLDFVSWSIDAEGWSILAWKSYRKKFPNQFIGRIEFHIDGPQAIPGSKFVVIPLNDKFGHERHFRVLVPPFYSSECPSLRIRLVDPVGLDPEWSISCVGECRLGKCGLKMARGRPIHQIDPEDLEAK